MVQSMLKLAGLDRQAPTYSTLCRRQCGLQVRIPYRRSESAVHLLVDNTGLKILGEGEWEWKRKKHGTEYRRRWPKVHLAIDAQTLEVRAVGVTSSNVGDAPMLEDLLGQISCDEPIASVSADGAYDTKRCHAVIAQRGAQAVTPTRRNAKPWREGPLGACVRNEILRATQRLGRTIWRH
jgi:Transposase DDE domain